MLKFDMNRSFGIEIEAVGATLETVSAALTRAGIRNFMVTNYQQVHTNNHLASGAWKVVKDGSLTGPSPFELVSPKLQGEDGFAQIRNVCAVLATLGVTVNDTCGFHVHHDASDFDGRTWRNLVMLYARLEKKLDESLPGTRRSAQVNYYCHGIAHKMDAVSSNGRKGHEALANVTSQPELVQWFRDFAPHTANQPRYHKVNVHTSWDRHKTVEFRQHCGTVDAEQIESWVILTQLMIDRAKQVRKDLTWSTEPTIIIKELALNSLGKADPYVQKAIKYTRTRLAHFRKVEPVAR